mmetsp:Transcript_81380/g.158966  ORF Transcript_81380/g.158966 Transcript_81380/m.158966 type:complete len:166 (+) Transcript_81380:71-568(+)
MAAIEECSSDFSVEWKESMLGTRITDDVLAATLSSSIAGPPLQGAVYCRFRTALTAANYLGPLGMYMISRPAAASKAAGITKETGVPLDAAVVFGVNSEALFIWSSNPMLSTVNSYLGAVPRSQISAVTTKSGTSWQELSIVLESGSEINVEARGGVHAFVSSFS